MKKTALALFLLLGGCGSYSEAGLGSSLDDAFVGQFGISRSGVSDTPLTADAYRIRGYGNQNASFEKTNALAMVRAAGLASSHGYDRFQIVDFGTWEKTSYHSTAQTAHTTTNIRANSYGGYLSGTATSTTTITPGRTYTLDRPRSDIVVKFVRADAPDAGSALRVADIITRYGKKAGLSPEEMQAAMNIAPANETDFAAPQILTESEAPVEPPPASATAPSPISYRQDGPTPDQIYKALSPSQKSRIDSLPLAQRADALMQIRDGTY